MNEFIIAIIFITLISLSTFSRADAIMLAKSWQDVSVDFVLNQDWAQTEYYMSEKYDGVRAIFDGKQLKTRSGSIIQMPNWLKESFSACSESCTLEGELWLGRNQFDELSGLVRSQNPEDKRWQQVLFIVFDAPKIEGDFIARKQYFEHVVKLVNHKQFKSAGHQLITSAEQLNEYYELKIAKQAEGIMLINGQSEYQNARSSDLIKRKPLMDAEATVVGLTKGKGKFVGLMGALIVKDSNGREFKIGTGFNMSQRANPPELGEVITYQYNGLTKNGLPRFARFLRVRDVGVN
ncbi:DNA ligase [Marinicellulosiphila megalodicopiae]|uniref:DNA ligase n=1 Tax=Marinicellulosiphila megalodicopiae TaxID=2724896 RepID=UPI003BAF236B